ncbi:hypothetical protein FE783_35975 [Paenibacillus mesophilus]|uniref:hypothetical protein n=1 Tax=Paenibacillus mesophilus TaxID=2582849 RepID=UPI00110DA916|nr:hypothetical protein [Paenibacillus mesophilus]TMV43176.1 hypothetical protein FE783_35975 [Paenibacillus mesophilus]
MAAAVRPRRGLFAGQVTVERDDGVVYVGRGCRLTGRPRGARSWSWSTASGWAKAPRLMRGSLCCGKAEPRPK